MIAKRYIILLIDNLWMIPWTDKKSLIGSYNEQSKHKNINDLYRYDKSLPRYYIVMQ